VAEEIVDDVAVVDEAGDVVAEEVDVVDIAAEDAVEAPEGAVEKE